VPTELATNTEVLWAITEGWFHATGREPIRVIYEEFLGARAAAVGRVLDSLGIDPPERAGERGPMLRQADNLSEEWVARFRHDDAEQQFTA
jgi:LPS sulfotransferase NodH